MSSIIGTKVKISVFGESHGEAIGVVIDGLPAGYDIDFDKVYEDIWKTFFCVCLNLTQK